MARKNIKLVSEKRKELGRGVKPLRREGKTPAVIYGNSYDSKSITIVTKEFEKVLSEAGYTRFIDLEIDGNTEVVLIKNVDIHPLKRSTLHVEFYKINMESEISATVPVVIVGLAPAVKNNLGLQITPVEEIDIRCLPTVLPEQIEIAADVLVNVGDSVQIKDIVLPEGVVLEASVDVNQSVVMIVAPQIEEEVENEEEKVETVITTEKKKDDEEVVDKGAKKEKKDDSK